MPQRARLVAHHVGDRRYDPGEAPDHRGSAADACSTTSASAPRSNGSAASSASAWGVPCRVEMQDENLRLLAGLQHRVLSRRAGSADQHQQVRAGEERRRLAACGTATDGCCASPTTASASTRRRGTTLRPTGSCRCGSARAPWAANSPSRASPGRGTVVEIRVPVEKDAGGLIARLASRAGVRSAMYGPRNLSSAPSDDSSCGLGRAAFGRRWPVAAWAVATRALSDSAHGAVAARA